MSTDSKWKSALELFVAELRQMYGSRLNRVILYGSRARGEADDDSDLDILVVLQTLGDFWEELHRINPIASRLSLEYDQLISALPVDLDEYEHDYTPFLVNTRHEGVVVG
ncbi:MAG: nucleotidyltransferase domain-containing protein [Phycisphaerales bacterium]|nr:nucleotidyltransferase domain-containing protein [Phycisphaerales bacterium]